MSLYEGISTDKPAVVLDLGTRYTKFGFVGEFNPRCIVRSEVKCPQSGKIRKIFDYKNEEDLYALLVEFIHILYFKHVLVSPKDRHVVIVESVLSPTVLRDTLARVFYKHFEVASILFVPSHLVALCPLGIRTGLVVDIGYTEVQIIPVYEGVPILTAWQAQPLAGEAIEKRLRGNFIDAYENLKNAGGDSNKYTQDISKLSDSIIEDIKVRGCFATTMKRAKDYAEGHPKPPPDLPYEIAGESIISVPGHVREIAYEVLFEKDNDQMSLPNLILDSILKCGLDTRRPLAENLVLIGGTFMAPGLKARLLEEIRALLSTPRYSSKLPLKSVKIHTPPAKDNYVSWLGGAIFGATDMIQMRGLSRENYLSLNTVPDWSNLAHNALLIIRLTI